MSIGTTFVLLWFAVPVAALFVLVPIVIWAIKARQFSDQDHARYLPLDSPSIKTDRPSERTPENESHVLP